MCFTWEVPQVNKGFWFKDLTVLNPIPAHHNPSTEWRGGSRTLKTTHPPISGWQCQYVLTLPTLRNP